MQLISCCLPWCLVRQAHQRSTAKCHLPPVNWRSCTRTCSLPSRTARYCQFYWPCYCTWKSEACNITWNNQMWMDGRTDGRMDGWMDGWIDGWMGWWVDGWLNGWMDGLVGRWVAEWMDGWLDGRINKIKFCWGNSSVDQFQSFRSCIPNSSW